MRARRFTAVIDACSLVGVLERNMLLSLAAAGLYRPHWSIETLAEMERAIRGILEKRGSVDPVRIAAHQREQIEIAFPESAVNPTRLVSALNLPDEKDRHVLAAAVHHPRRDRRGGRSLRPRRRRGDAGAESGGGLTATVIASFEKRPHGRSSGRPRPPSS